ncbi:MAG: hypothetical protein SGCHY_002884 [Lobulomycetales sp.]
MFLLCLFDIRLAPEVYRCLDNSMVSYRVPGRLIHERAHVQAEYSLDLTMLDCLLVSTSTTEIKSQLIRSFQDCGPLRFVQKFSHNLVLLQYYDSRDAEAAFQYHNGQGGDIKIRYFSISLTLRSQVNIDAFTETDFHSSSALLNALNIFALTHDPNDAEGSVSQAIKKKQTQAQTSTEIAPLLTVMIRNIPNKYSQDQLLEVLDATQLKRGLGRFRIISPRTDYDFVYLRMDFVNHCNVGYSFVNFTSREALNKFITQRVGKRWPMFNSEKICSYSPAHVQGLESLIEKFRDSSIMKEEASYRPQLYGRDGSVLEFPAPLGGRLKPPSNINYTRARPGSAAKLRSNKLGGGKLMVWKQ